MRQTRSSLVMSFAVAARDQEFLLQSQKFYLTKIIPILWLQNLFKCKNWHHQTSRYWNSKPQNWDIPRPRDPKILRPRDNEIPKPENAKSWDPKIAKSQYKINKNQQHMENLGNRENITLFTPEIQFPRPQDCKILRTQGHLILSPRDNEILGPVYRESWDQEIPSHQDHEILRHWDREIFRPQDHKMWRPTSRKLFLEFLIVKNFLVDHFLVNCRNCV